MPKGFHILTITHRQTNLSKIGSYVLQNVEGDETRISLEKLKAQFGLDEIMYLATCNRVAYFFFIKEAIPANFSKIFFQSINASLTEEEIETEVMHYQDQSALDHLFQVSASIDSLVIGEREILRQLREAYNKAVEWNLTGDNIRLAMDSAVVAAKDVYNNTRIGEKPISVVSLAFEQLLKYNLAKDARILMIGAGQTNALVTKFLVKHNYNNVTVFNRTFEKAADLAQKTNGQAFPLSELENYDQGFDCMIVCTGATNAFVNTELYEKLLKGEKDRKIVIDLAIPNNVSKDLSNSFNLNYIEIEDLRNMATANMDFRKKEVNKASLIIENHLQQFQATYRQRQIEKAMRRVPSEIKAVKEFAMTEVFRKDLENLDENTRLLLEKMMSYMEKKCIGIPMKAAREVVL